MGLYKSELKENNMKKKILITLGLVTVLVFTVLSAYPALANAIYNIDSTHIENVNYSADTFTVNDIEKNKALEIAMSDARVKELLSGKKYSIMDYGPAQFSGPDQSLTKYGVFIRIDFSQPYHINFSYPDRQYLSRNLDDYKEITNILNGDVEALGITVDMKNGNIERIIPIPKLTPEIFDPLP
jgi:hypothetical protein